MEKGIRLYRIDKVEKEEEKKINKNKECGEMNVGTI